MMVATAHTSATDGRDDVRMHVQDNRTDTDGWAVIVSSAYGTKVYSRHDTQTDALSESARLNNAAGRLPGCLSWTGPAYWAEPIPA
jgi:hypothetical protein